jgi:hypothetical protein
MMKHSQTPFLFCLIAICVCLLSSCSFNQTLVINDEIRNVKTAQISYRELDVRLNRSPLEYLEQTILKTVHPGAGSSYEVFDQLVLDNKSFAPDPKVYLIIDGKIVEPKITRIESGSHVQIHEHTDDIITADSTEISVVTGYSETNQQLVRFQYSISENLLRQIAYSEQTLIRYYAGPAIITVRLSGMNKNRISKLLSEY